VPLAQLADFRRGLVVLSAGTPDELVAAASVLGTEALFAEVQRHLDPAEERENRRRLAAARARGLRVVAGGGIRHTTPQLKALYDVLTASGSRRRWMRRAARCAGTPSATSAHPRRWPRSSGTCP